MTQNSFPIVTKENSSVEWETLTCIVACVGVGNVSQLACDLLIHNLNCTPVLHVDFRYVPSVTGCDPYSSPANGYMTSCQVYMNRELSIAILQTRSPPYPGCRQKHSDEVAEFLSKLRCARIILLSSSYAMQRKDTELMGPQIRFAASKTFDPTTVRHLEGLELLPLLPHTDDDITQLDPGAQPPTTYRLPGAGIASYLFDKLDQSDSVTPFCLLNIFVSEGDNSADALSVVRTVVTWLNLFPKSNMDNSPRTVLFPPSWSLLYGHNPDVRLY